MAILAAWEQSTTDTFGSYNLTNVGSGATVKTDIVYGSYTQSLAATASNTVRIPNALATVLASKSEWNIEAYVYMAKTGYAQSYFMGAYAGVAGTYNQFTGFSGNAGMQIYYNSITVSAVNVFPSAGWYFWSVQWKSNQLKVYINGTLYVTINSASNQFSTGAGNVWNFLTEYDVQPNTGSRINRIIVGDVARDGVETPLASVPTITSLDVTSGYIIGGDTAIITGTNFLPSPSVTFGGTSATVISSNTTTITCVTPAHAAGVVNVTVTNTDTGTVTSIGAFTYVAPSITSISPSSGLIFGSASVTITGNYFQTGATVSFGLLQATSVVVVSSTTITCLTPAQAAGTVTVTVNNPNTTTATFTFLYYNETLFVPSSLYSVFINGYDVTKYLTTRITQVQELNILVKNDIAFDDIEVSLPKEVAYQLYNNDTDRLTVTKNNELIFTGYIKTKTKDYGNNRVKIVASPTLQLVSKNEAIVTQAVADNGATLLYKLLKSLELTDYTITSFVTSAQNMFGCDVLINTNGKYKNIMSVIGTLCTLMDMNIFVYKDIIRMYALTTFDTDVRTIDSYLLKRPITEERPLLFYNKIVVEYETAPGAGVLSVSAGSGTLVKKVTASDIYMTATAAQNIADRKLALYDKLYTEAEFSLDTQRVLALGIEVGEYFIFDVFIFLCTYKEEHMNITKIRGLGYVK